MSSNTHLQTWVSRETKERFTAVARAQGISESALLKRLVEALIGPAVVGEATFTPELGLLVSDTPEGKVSLRFPAHALEDMYPQT
jgi:hypothetical protein